MGDKYDDDDEGPADSALDKDMVRALPWGVERACRMCWVNCEICFLTEHAFARPTCWALIAHMAFALR
jgi:hypothetical protein